MDTKVDQAFDDVARRMEIAGFTAIWCKYPKRPKPRKPLDPKFVQMMNGLMNGVSAREMAEKAIEDRKTGRTIKFP